MPSAPLGFCPAHGCPTRSHGPCEAHRQQKQRIADERRGSRHERGYTNAWADYSKRRLAEHPFCVGYPPGVHGNLKKLAECTDHILSAKDHPDHFWEPTNHQSLCFACNRAKANAEEGGFGR